MTFIADSIFDGGLDYATTNGNRVDICSQEPTTYTEATSTYTLGNKTSATVGAAANGAVDGRAVEIAAVTDGSVTGTATATHSALTYTTGTELLASKALSSSQAVTSGNTFTITAWSITIRDAA